MTSTVISLAAGFADVLDANGFDASITDARAEPSAPPPPAPPAPLPAPHETALPPIPLVQIEAAISAALRGKPGSTLPGACRTRTLCTPLCLSRTITT